jgi:uncharacterized protein CbrC (UPF0167 family)
MIPGEPETTLDDLLSAAAELPSENTAQRVAHLLVVARPDASAESLAALIRGPLEVRVAGEYGVLASTLEQHPERLASALAGPPLQQDQVLRRALRLQWFERLVGVAPEVRDRVRFNVPFDELKDWGRFAQRGCASFCEAFRLRHPIFFDAVATNHGPDAVRAQAEVAWGLDANDWNGGRAGRPSVLPWAYLSLIRAGAAAGYREEADRLVAQIPTSWSEHAAAQEAIAMAAIRAGALDEAEQRLKALKRSGLDKRALSRHWGLLLFRRSMGDYLAFLDLLMSSPWSRRDMVASVFWDAIENEDAAPASAVLLALSSEQGFKRLEEQRNTWGSFLIELLSTSRRYEEALDWCGRVLKGGEHGYRAARIAYFAALHGNPTTARAILRSADSERARAVEPLLAAVEGGPFAAVAGLPAHERLHWLLFEMESRLGRSTAVGQSIAGFSAPRFRPDTIGQVTVPTAIEPSGLATIPEDAEEESFDTLGVPFALYAAPPSSCSRYVGAGNCAVTGRDELHCFRVDALIDSCVRCGGPVERGNEPSTCIACGHAAPPHTDSTGDDEIIVGYDAIARGKAAFVVDTEFGMVTPQLAMLGRTHGVAGLDAASLMGNDLALRRMADSDWVQVLVQRELLWELVRTPPYTTWQGECWLFHCGAPMVFVGELTVSGLIELELEERAIAMLEEVEAMSPEADGMMTFACRRCSLHRFHVDRS